MKKGTVPPPRIRILILDDHPLVRQGIKATLEDETDIEVCAEAYDCDTALKLAELHKPDIILLDLTLEEGSGLDLLRSLGKASWDVKTLVLSMHDEQVYAERCFRAGARGFLMKSHGPGKLIQAIRTIHEGKLYASNSLLQRVLAGFTSSTTTERNELAELTNREFQIFELIGQGKTSKQVAEVLGISSKTVDVHRIRIRAKLDISSNSDLVRFAVEWLTAHNTTSAV